MKTLMILFTCSFLILSACTKKPASTKVKTTPPSIFVLFENGGTIPENEQADAINTAMNLFQQLADLDKHKATRSAQIHIVLSARPNLIAWSGTPRQLLAQAKDVRTLISFKPSFSDLVMAFKQIETTIQLTQPGDIKFYWIGPTIHVPFQTTDSKIEVEVPQPVPGNLALLSFSDQLSTLKIMRVHPDQDEILLAYLGANGILERAKHGDLDFSLLGVAQTKSNLENLL